jgi:hypothetical protein
VRKILGSRTPKMDKCIFGVLISSVILFILIGPLFFFSDYGGFVAPNPVTEGELQFSFVIKRNMSNEDFINNLVGESV